ncbi:MAG: PepSY-associated TM helix domain-containing protein [Pseudomonadota bacterium]
MERDRRVRIYNAHSWTGISLGLFLFVVCFTGSVALFHHELQSWEDPARRVAMPESPIPVQPLVDDWVAAYAPENITFLGVHMPDFYEPYYMAFANVREAEGEPVEFRRIRWHAATGDVLPERGDGLSTWLLDFHRDLMWPDALGGRQIGRGLVGIAGVIMLLSIITGILTHRKILKEFFTYRTKKTVRVKWKDAHNFLGIWSLPFSTMIAFTGAWLGIVVLLLPITAMLVFKGDTEKVVEVVAGAPAERAGISAPMISFDEMAQREHSTLGGKPVYISATLIGDKNAEYVVNYKPESRLFYFESERVSAVTGELLPATGLNEPTAATRTLAAMSPLHYGTFGGAALKFLYLGLGLATSVMIALGNMVWIERRANSAEGSQSPQFYDRLSRLTAGVCAGVAVATVAIFYTDVFYHGDEDARIFWIGVTYFGVWLAATLFAFIAANGYRATRTLTAVTGVSMLGVPVLSFLSAGEMPLAAFARGHLAAPAADATIFVLGLITLIVAYRLPTERKAEKNRQRRRAKPAAAMLEELGEEAA